VNAREGPPDKKKVGALGSPDPQRLGMVAQQHKGTTPAPGHDGDAAPVHAQNLPVTASQQVSWLDVHEHVAPLLARVGSWPMVGTPTWCALPDGDPAKLAALYDAAQHWALRLETNQQALAETSRDVSAAADWSAIGQQIRNRVEFYAERPWLRRETA
jgi:hypothetical protein